jgi:hypothetical protein
MSLKIINKNKIIVAYLISILMIGTVLQTVHSDPTGPWWNTSWNYRKEITIDHTKVFSTNTNFPLLIQITDTDLKLKAQSDGKDIAFTDKNGIQLNHEIEKYNSTTGELTAWVKIPTLSSTQDTTLYLYYGNPNADNQQNIEATWDSNFLAVYHLDETSGTAFDSTSHNNDGVHYGFPNQNVVGKIDGADFFDGVDDHLTLPRVYTSENQFTLEAWIYAQTGARYFISQWNNYQGVFLQVGKTPDHIEWYIDSIGGSISGIVLNTWYHIVMTYDGITARIYRNAEPSTNKTCAPPTWPSEGMYLGDCSAGDRQFNGTIDEVRFSNIARSAAWVTTCYNNQFNPSGFYSLGGQEQVPSGGNQPPIFGTPTPINASANNLISFTWSIPINDPEGNTFEWTIQCSNGQVNSGTGASNGTKSLSLTGLGYSTAYKVWVNATDPTGSGLYTRRWYTFTTKTNLVNTPPVFGTPSPANGSTGNLLSLSWSIPINDPEGNLFSWIIQCSDGEFQGGNFAVNGTKTLDVSHLAYSTTYIIWVNANDPTGSGLYTRRWYTFTTKTNLVNNPPVFGTPSPLNGSTGNLLSLSWSIPINDPEGNTFTWTIQCNNGQTNTTSGANNGTKTLILSGLVNSTNYKVWVNATDPTGSGLYTRRWYTFTTKTNLVNNPPVFGTPSPLNGSTGNLLSLSWSIPISDLDGDSFNWVIQCSNGQSANANGASNGTKSLSLSGLANLTTYKVWVNATDPTGSGLYTRKWYTFTTQQQNLPPNKPNQPSGNNSGKIKIVYTYTTSTIDPNGDQVYYLWDWGDGNNSGWLGPYNSGVTISTTHKWTVKGSYSIKVKAKDIYGKESVWSDPLPIKMPYSFNKLILQFLEWLFQRFPHVLPILRHLLGY